MPLSKTPIRDKNIQFVVSFPTGAGNMLRTEKYACGDESAEALSESLQTRREAKEEHAC